VAEAAAPALEARDREREAASLVSEAGSVSFPIWKVRGLLAPERASPFPNGKVCGPRDGWRTADASFGERCELYRNSSDTQRFPFMSMKSPIPTAVSEEFVMLSQWLSCPAGGGPSAIMAELIDWNAASSFEELTPV